MRAAVLVEPGRIEFEITVGIAHFGDLAGQPRFVDAYLWALHALHRDGARATLEALLARARR
jgi:hypothetical protein